MTKVPLIPPFTLYKPPPLAFVASVPFARPPGHIAVHTYHVATVPRWVSRYSAAQVLCWPIRTAFGKHARLAPTRFAEEKDPPTPP
ncbi:uncharacterized protein K460DRAFT_114872 [Cucurbitaria berberidis CBS 394.84]|uniref:Uncharacterized protein n=1 Tax=Cucurbitaria berberidis CBS 394.84 TaxID=1168544 RepID=A0A9P4L887_9PLEO|nr:uncharacterized protein K460DRAFT_114872 [Cucurbitaria berberidis CBS 394.84]KAF1845765.1 hypothetical protein K460DRAFT_114872 [Cucurbitaria berberidis CBS 394.84]